MSKEIGSGKATMQQHLMDATIAMNRASSTMLDHLNHLDTIKQADLADDPFMVAALKAIVAAAEETNPAAKQGFIEDARTAIEKACELDFADTSIEEAKAALMPSIKLVDECKHNFLDLQEKLARKAKTDAAKG